MIYIASDHGGFVLKESLKKRLRKAGIKYHDVGAAQLEKKDDYPLIARTLAKRVVRSAKNKGIIICRSGVGVNIATNKMQGIRSVLAESVVTARKSRRDDNTNVLALGAEVVSEQRAWKIVSEWLSTRFRSSVRDRRRLNEIASFERTA